MQTSFMLPANGQATPKSIERRRKMAEAMLANSADTSPVGHWTQAAGRIAQGLVGGMGAYRADKQEAEGTQSAKDAMIKALNGGDRASLIDAASNPFMSSAGASMIGSQWDRMNQPPPNPELKDLGGGQFYQYDPRDPQGSGEMFTPEGYQAPAPDPTDDMREYQFYIGEAQKAGQQPVDFFTWQKAKTPQTNITNSMGGEVPDGELRKELQKNEAKNWGELQNVASVSAQTAQDLTIVDELIEMAPTGPVTGRLAEAFPGVSSSAAALDSIVKRLAPTLRVPGSGATSDIEYEGMLRGYPALRNYPEANRLISQIMKAKAGINVERGQIIDAYSSGQIDAPTARAQLNELNKRSILSPEMRRLLAGVDPGAGAKNVEDMSDEELEALSNGP